MVGQRIGNYEIVERLGEGGMGTVYLALHPELRRRVAVKVLHPDLAHHGEMIQRFFNEARAANAIGHRGIVEVSDLGILPSGAPYIVMELLDGESLADRLAKAGRLPLAAAIEIAGQAADVVGAAHAKGIIHRDLKPDNLYLIPDPHLPGRELLKILDFGIAKLAERRPSSAGGDLRTRTGAILGTPRYMSPEQCRESRDVDHRTDVYSLGVVLYEMLSGAPPFASGSWVEMAFMHIAASPPALQTRAPDVPDGVAQIVHRALEKNPGARFQSMADLKEALEASDGARPLALPTPKSAGVTAAAPSVASFAPVLEPRTVTASLPVPGSTMRFEEPAPARATRRTTLAGAASELLHDPATSKRAPPPMRALLVAAGVAAIAIASVLAVRRAPSPMSTSSSPPLIAAPAAPPPAPAALPPPIVEPPPAPPPVAVPSAAAEDPEIAPADRDRAATPEPEMIPRPTLTKPARRQRSPAKPAAPARVAPRPPEPLKI